MHMRLYFIVSIVYTLRILALTESIEDNTHCQLGFSHGSQVRSLTIVMNILL